VVDVFYVFEVNFCVSCIVLFVSKVMVVLLVKVVLCIMFGVMIVELWVEGLFLLFGDGMYLFVGVLVLIKEVVLLFKWFVICEGLVVDIVFGFEMCFIGEVMGIDEIDLWCIVGVGLYVLFIIEVFFEELIFGWKEYEFEFMCDKYDNVVVVCLIENFDLMGVYIGDLIIVVLVMIFIDCEY